VTSVLVLENGLFFSGRSFGASKDATGEVCFNTSMSGYQEILTDPSYCGQIVAMTYPMIGNYGINRRFDQSNRVQCAGFVVKQYVRRPSNHLSEKPLGDYLMEQGIPGIEGIDTRRLVLTLREEGALRGGIFQGMYNPEMLERVRSIPPMSGQALATVVTTNKHYVFGSTEGKRYRIAVLDFGVKRAILQYLNECGFEVHVFPATTSFEDLKHFDCYFLSNGPGDPAPLTTAIETTRSLLNTGKPLFGICLGHQILGLARNWKTYKLKFGHRGGNQPVRDNRTGRVEITAQNHGFAVDAAGEGGLEIIYTNLNDHTVEGFRDRSGPVISVQHHPEASPGPHDSLHMFADFYQMVEDYYAGRRSA
jgi:carbamoyl-phosphate synthase small subunit